MTKRMKNLIIGLGMFLLVWACWTGVSRWAVGRLYDAVIVSVDDFADEFYALYNNQEYSHIYNVMTSQEYRNIVSYDEFNNTLLEVRNGVGKYKDREIYSWRIRKEGKETYFYIEYDVTYERGTTNENFFLKENEDSWIILVYEFE